MPQVTERPSLSSYLAWIQHTITEVIMATVYLIIGLSILALILYFAVNTWSDYFRNEHHHH